MEPKQENVEFSEMLDGLKHQFTSYMNTCYEMYSLKAVRKISTGATTILIVGIVSLFIILMLVFASVATAICLNETMASTYAGFLIVSGFYAILALLAYVLRKRWMRKTIQDGIICEMLKD